ncbi:hypothetical protein BDB00DRAFT_851505 [Zychaea mexicana]|uniref:uncharacterized protein n=1 Tax=Zychaea mexicana TaxID=64656 RepID=UPI0022FDD32F|nr:uncharacterized protein BDB00DRAFT_851505 [Zychaea mexicana]KAI9485101.1 hypothetical protein BDB00DRAFT_851505 [Zychaea mexicana]
MATASNPEAYKPERLAKPTTISPGELLFVRVKNWPWWPAIIVADDEVTPDVVKSLAKPNENPTSEQYYILFLHSFDFGRVPIEKIRVFDHSQAQAALSNTLIKRLDLRAALRLALDPEHALSLHRPFIDKEMERDCGTISQMEFDAWDNKQKKVRRKRAAVERTLLAQLMEMPSTDSEKQQPSTKTLPAQKTNQAPKEETQGRSENETQHKGDQDEEQAKGRGKRHVMNKTVEASSSSTTGQLKQQPARSTRRKQVIKHEGETVVEQPQSVKQEKAEEVEVTVDDSPAPAETQQPVEESQQSTRTDPPSQTTAEESQESLKPGLTEQPQPTSIQSQKLVDEEAAQLLPADHVKSPPVTTTIATEQPIQNEEQRQHMQHQASASESLPQESVHQQPLQEQQQNMERRSRRKSLSPEKSESSQRPQEQRRGTPSIGATKREAEEPHDDAEKPQKKRVRRTTNDNDDDDDVQMQQADTPQQEQQEPGRGQSPTDVAVVPLSPGARVPAAELNRHLLELPKDDSRVTINNNDDNVNNDQVIEEKPEAMQVDEEIQTPVPTATTTTSENVVAVIESPPQQVAEVIEETGIATTMITAATPTNEQQQQQSVLVPNGSDDTAAYTTSHADERLTEERQFKRAIIIKYRLQTLIERHRPGKWPVKDNRLMRVAINDIRKAQLSKNTVQLLHLRHWVSLASKYTFSKEKDIVFDYKAELASILDSWDP